MSNDPGAGTTGGTTSDQAVDTLLDQLDASQAASLDHGRKNERFRYRKRRLLAWIKQPGDAEAKKFYVVPRNLSECGIAFLHGGFVHHGSQVSVQLITLHGTWRDVDGDVATCRFISGKLHEIGVEFASHIEPAEYCIDAVNPRVLLVDDDPSIARLTQVLLTKLNADVTHVDNGQAAVERASSETFDLIMMDLEMPGMDGLTATRELRSRGYSGKIIAATARTQPADRQECLEAGCDDFLPKPYDKETLARVLDSVNSESVFSTLSDDEDLAEVIDAFIREVPARIRELEDAALKDDATALETLARRLKGEGSMYGFAVISEFAAEIESSLGSDASVPHVRDKLNELIQLCMQIRSTSISSTAPALPAGQD